MIEYISTRGRKEGLRSAQAIIKGLSEDRGLFVPTELPKLPFQLKNMMGKGYQEVATQVLGAFLPDFTKEEITRCVNSAYDDKFDTPDVAKMVKVGQANFLELYHGKTAAFKDMALSILPYLMTTSIKKEKEEGLICILTATSGDTGKAALEGFANVPGCEIVVFYPSQGVSQVQKQQMITQTGENTHVFAIEGNFDDAQTGVKDIFNDEAFAQKLAGLGVKLSSANSINIGRLVPQVAYYVYSYIKLLETGQIKEGEEMNVVVPTGNFGNILAAYYAKKMGTPIKKFICASNENRVLTDFINTGIYDTRREFHLTNSPSMDILISSNLERLLYHLSGGNGDYINDLMNQLQAQKVYSVNDDIKQGLKAFYGGSATVTETIETIGKVYREENYLMDTHTAVAYKVYRDYVEATGDKAKAVIASTASPYKFAESVAKAIGLEPGQNGFRDMEMINSATKVKIPEGLRNLDTKEVRHKGLIQVTEMKNTVYESIK